MLFIFISFIVILISIVMELITEEISLAVKGVCGAIIVVFAAAILVWLPIGLAEEYGVIAPQEFKTEYELIKNNNDKYFDSFMGNDGKYYSFQYKNKNKTIIAVNATCVGIAVSDTPKVEVITKRFSPVIETLTFPKKEISYVLYVPDINNT